MITTVTMNPCVDLAVRVDRLRTGEKHVVSESSSSFGGKGVNVAIALHALGAPCRCTGIAFADRAADLEKGLRESGIPCDFIRSPGSFRTNIKLMDRDTGTMTELNSPGDPVSPQALQKAEDTVMALARESRLVVLSGSLPKDCPVDFYRGLIRKLRETSAMVVLDSSGPALTQAVKERPWLIKPNLYELEQAFGCHSNHPGEILSVCGRLLSVGVGVVCVSLGEKGALIADRGGEAFWAEAVGVEPRTLHGAGDAMVAGLCRAAIERQDLAEMLRSGIAAAGAWVQRGTGEPFLSGDFHELRERVRVRRLAP